MGLAAVMCSVAVLAVPPAAVAAVVSPVEGDGSAWASNAVSQWIADVQPQGLNAVYTATGSAQGRRDFAQRATDFAVTDVPFQGIDPVTGDSDTALGRPFGYLPLVAGGTSFPYHLSVGGRLVRDLRLSGLTLARIFTNQITNWADPAITADNNGRMLPAVPITPVVHSEGSGASLQFSRYLAHEFPSLWTSFAHTSSTPYFPRQGRAVAQNGSNGVMNYVASTAGDGAIGYDEYTYAFSLNYPTAKIGNSAGYFTAPTALNVAVSLTRATVELDPASPAYLTANLDQVYSFTDPRTYPLSSYSYLILPTGTNAQDSRMTTGRRQTLANFLTFGLCAGQQTMSPLGYAPLPINLVRAGLDQLQRLHAADPAVTVTATADAIATCPNPTFVARDPDRDYLAEIAPLPMTCDRVGHGPCGTSGSGPTMPASSASVPIEATNGSTPYGGDLTLRIDAGESVTLGQLDPDSADGHPGQATDPTGHRHAWVFAGDLAGIAVLDTRPSQPGWTLIGQATAFVNGPVVVGAQNLGWSPTLVATGSDAEGSVRAGPIVDPALRLAGSDGLATSRVLAAADAQAGLGAQNIGAHLRLWTPDTVPTGRYQSTLTLTLVGP